MSAFEAAATNDRDDLAFALASVGFVSLFHDPQVLSRATQWFTEHNYRVIEVDCAGWSEESDLHAALAAALEFPAGYQPSLDALAEHLADIALYRNPVASGEATGTVVVLANAGTFVFDHPSLTHALLDIFADSARLGALVGHRMLCLLQVDDVTLRLPGVGDTPVAWNPAEAAFAGAGESRPASRDPDRRYISWI